MKKQILKKLNSMPMSHYVFYVALITVDVYYMIMFYIPTFRLSIELLKSMF